MHTYTAPVAAARGQDRGPTVLSLSDLVRGHLDGVASIVEVAGPDPDLRLRLDPDPARTPAWTPAWARNQVPRPGAPGEAPGTARAGITLERDRRARALRGAQRELVGVQEKLMALERLTSLEVGRAVVGVALRPWREGARLPLDLYRLWRERSGAAPARRTGGDPADRPGGALALLQDRGGQGLGDRWLAAFTTPGQPPAGDSPGDAGGLVITGALTALSCATIEPDAVVHPLLPHDADFVLEGTGADLVLIETAALLPGCGWAYAGDPAATDRGRRLAAVISLARSLGKPVVLLRNAPWHLIRGLDWLTASCDA